jgi:polyhydroxyalkanoate synthesis repressor PhaR
VAEKTEPLLIKRYASRRLYNTESSDYVTLEEIARFIRGGRDVKIVDLKSGEDLTRSYLLQIISDHESNGDTVLPVNILTDIVRAYATEVQSVVPQFLSTSFDMFRQGQEKVLDSFSGLPGFEALKAQQAAFRRSGRSVRPRKNPNSTRSRRSLRRCKRNWRRWAVKAAAPRSDCKC